MEREITPERSGQKQESLETKSPQAKVISNAHIFQRADQVTEIMNLILAISHFSRLGSPLVVQPRPLVGGSVSTRGHEEWEDIWNLQFLFPLLISQSEGREKGLPWTVSD